jgi:hypothetical protein
LDRATKIKDKVNNYYDFYKIPQPETLNNCLLLNKYLRVDFRTLEDYNQTLKNNYEKKKYLPVETNPHHISHYIRSVFECRNITEKINYIFESDTGDVIPSRPIIDINATRILNAGLTPIILTPTLAVDDKDRNQKVRTAVKRYNDFVTNTLNSDEMEYAKTEIESFRYDVNMSMKKGRDSEYDDLIPKPEYVNLFLKSKQIKEEGYENKDGEVIDRKLKLVQTYNLTLQQASRQKLIPKNALINLTDIIYYLNNDDLYEIASRMDDGSIMVGTAHVPKYFDIDQHPIQFEATNSKAQNTKDSYIQKQEGIMFITPVITADKNDYSINEVKMVMKMKGNSYKYVHGLKYMEYLHATMASDLIITNHDYNFILKCVPLERVDCTGTYYIRFEIQKITNPVTEDLIGDYFTLDYSKQYSQISKLLKERQDAVDRNWVKYYQYVADINAYNRKVKEISDKALKQLNQHVNTDSEDSEDEEDEHDDDKSVKTGNLIINNKDKQIKTKQTIVIKEHHTVPDINDKLVIVTEEEVDFSNYDLKSQYITEVQCKDDKSEESEVSNYHYYILEFENPAARKAFTIKLEQMKNTIALTLRNQAKSENIRLSKPINDSSSESTIINPPSLKIRRVPSKEVEFELEQEYPKRPIIQPYEVTKTLSQIIIQVKSSAVNEKNTVSSGDLNLPIEFSMKVPNKITFRKATIKQGQKIPIEPPKPQIPVFLKDGHYYFTRQVVSEQENTIYTIREKIDDMTKEINTITTVVNPLLINKLTARIMTEPELDAMTMKALIKFINSSAPELDIPTQVIPLLARVLMHVFDSEKRLGSIMASSLVRNINDFRKGEYKIEEYKEPTYAWYEKLWRWLTTLWRMKEKDIQLSSGPQDFTPAQQSLH